MRAVCALATLPVRADGRGGSGTAAGRGSQGIFAVACCSGLENTFKAMGPRTGFFRGRGWVRLLRCPHPGQGLC